MRSNRIRRKFFVLENINFAIRTYCDTAFASMLTKSQQSKFFVLENINFYEYSKILFCSAGRAPPK